MSAASTERSEKTVWILELHLAEHVPASLIMKREFDNLPALRLSIMENRERRSVITAPASMTPGDRTALLDMRADGYLIEFR